MVYIFMSVINMFISDIDEYDNIEQRFSCLGLA